MKKTLATLTLAGLGLFASAQEKKEILKDTSIVNYNQDTLIHTEYKGNKIQEKEYVLMNDDYKLIREKMSEYNDSNKVVLEKEDGFSYKSKTMNKSSSDPKNIRSKKQVVQIASYLKINRYHYDELGRLTKIEKDENHKIGNPKGLEKSAEYYLYIEENRNPLTKFEDNDGDGKLSEGDKTSIYNPKTKNWTEIEKTE